MRPRPGKLCSRQCRTNSATRSAAPRDLLPLPEANVVDLRRSSRRKPRHLQRALVQELGDRSARRRRASFLSTAGEAPARCSAVPAGRRPLSALQRRARRAPRRTAAALSLLRFSDSDSVALPGLRRRAVRRARRRNGARCARGGPPLPESRVARMDSDTTTRIGVTRESSRHSRPTATSSSARRWLRGPRLSDGDARRRRARRSRAQRSGFSRRGAQLRADDRPAAEAVAPAGAKRWCRPMRRSIRRFVSPRPTITKDLRRQNWRTGAAGFSPGEPARVPWSNRM